MKKLTKAQKQKLNELLAAAEQGDVGLVLATERATGEKVPLICSRRTLDDGSIEIRAFAKLLGDDVYDLYDPPA